MGLQIRLQQSSNCKKNLKKKRSSLFILTEETMNRTTKVPKCSKLNEKKQLEERIHKALLLRLQIHSTAMKL